MDQCPMCSHQPTATIAYEIACHPRPKHALPLGADEQSQTPGHFVSGEGS